VDMMHRTRPAPRPKNHHPK